MPALLASLIMLGQFIIPFVPALSVSIKLFDSCSEYKQSSSPT